MAAKRKRMTEAELAAVIDRQIVDSSSYHDSEIASHNRKAQRYFNGECDIKPMGKNRSQVVSRDVSDIHGLVLPGLMRVYFSSDRVAVFEPTRQDHEAYADQATDLVNYIVMRECDGYLHFRNAISDGVLFGNGLIKHWWDDTPEYTTSSFSALTDDRFRYVMSDPDIEEVIEHEEKPDENWQPDPNAVSAMQQIVNQAQMTGQPPVIPPELQAALTQPMLHDITIKRVKSTGRLRLEAVPYDEFRMDRNAKVLDETVRFAAHVFRRTRSDLVEDGYPRDKVDDLPAFGLDSEESYERDRLNRDVNANEAPDRSTELVEVYESYVLIDYDGDGIAERRRVVMGGGVGKRKILVNEEWGDDLPFSDLVPNPQAHTWRGRGLFDELEDIQNIKTVLVRGALDSVYRALRPHKYVPKGSVEDWDSLLDEEFGAITEFDGNKGVPQDIVSQPLLDAAGPMIDYMDATTERRTGISQRSQAMDLDALQNQSATAVNAAQTAAFSRIEEYARNLAEVGFKRIFECCLRLIVKHQDRASTIKLRGDWVEMDPRAWDSDMLVTINVGLGTGSRERDLAMLQGIKQGQELAISQFGPFDGPITVQHWMETMQKMSEAAGIRNPEAFFPDITDEWMEQKKKEMADRAGQQPPDPKMMEAQAKLQLQQQKTQADIQLQREKAAAKLQADAVENQQEREADMASAVLDNNLARDRASAELSAMRERMMQEIAIEREKMRQRMEIEREQQAANFELRQRELEYEAQLAAIRNASIGPQDTNIPRPE